MNIINIQAAKTHLSRLVEQAAAGEEIVLAKAGKPLVRLVPFKPTRKPREGGQWQGRVWEASDCWEPETEDLLDGTPLFPQETAAGTAALPAEDQPRTEKK